MKKKEEPIPESIQKIMEATKQSFDEISTQPRFGFFSIPPNQRTHIKENLRMILVRTIRRFLYITIQLSQQTSYIHIHSIIFVKQTLGE